ncbi:hypothetical protein CRYUN_Cryun04dG0086800 [Craigia yunnanensis]
MPQAQAMLKGRGRQQEGGDFSRYVKRRGSENSTWFTIILPGPILENACKDDAELRAVLGDSIGDPELMRKRLANSSMEYDPLYDADKGFKVMPSSFHDISDVEFQDNWGRAWVDLGTSDFFFSIDVFLNCMAVLSADYLGVQQIVFGDRRMGDWEEGMTNPDYGYKYFKI